MANRRSLFLVGLFVCSGIVFATTAVIWLGASKYFEKGKEYVTYFDESVQGLQVDSRVKYRGVDIGSVKRIRVAPDNRLVEVLLKVDLPAIVGSDVVSQLKAAGITGIVFVELDRHVPGDEVFYPPEEVKRDYPVIPSQPSQTKQMLSNVDKIMSRFERIDLVGAAEQFKGAGRAVEQFFSAGISLEGRLEEAARGLNTAMKKADKAIEDARVHEMAEEAKRAIIQAQATMTGLRDGISEARQLMTDIKREINELNARGLSDSLRSAVASIEEQTGRITAEIESTNEDIRRTTEGLRLLLARLNESPSDILFGRRTSADEERER